jgi:hypothetical protein
MYQMYCHQIQLANMTGSIILTSNIVLRDGGHIDEKAIHVLSGSVSCRESYVRCLLSCAYRSNLHTVHLGEACVSRLTYVWDEALFTHQVWTQVPTDYILFGHLDQYLSKMHHFKSKRLVNAVVWLPIKLCLIDVTHGRHYPLYLF